MPTLRTDHAMIPLPTPAQALIYEVESSWWAGYIGNDTLQNIIAGYFAWKVNRKMGRIIRQRKRIEEIRLRYVGSLILKS